MKHLTLRLVAAALLAATAAGAAFAQKVSLDTSEGTIVLELDREKAPKTVDNFLAYVRAGHYEGVIFHRVIENFMIQTGGVRPDLSQKPLRPPIPLESRNGLSNVRGTVAMARTNNPNSATAQFFINTVDNAFLDQVNATDGEGYAVFGRVTQGLDVVDRIGATPTRASGIHPNLPVKPVIIKRVTLEK